MPPAARTFLAISAYAIEKIVSTIVAKKNVAGPVAARAVRHRERRVVDEDRERGRPRHAEEEDAVQPDSVPLEFVDVTTCGDVDVACTHRPASCSNAPPRPRLPSPGVAQWCTLQRALSSPGALCTECRDVSRALYMRGGVHVRAAVSSDCLTTSPTSPSTFRRLLGFAAAHRRLLVWSIVLALAAQAFALAIPSLTGRAIDERHPAARPLEPVAVGLADRRRGR